MFPSCYSKPKNGSQFKMSYTKVIFGVLVVYVLHTCWAIYGFVYTKPCEGAKGDHCVTSYLTTKPRLQLSFYSTLDPNEESAHRLLLKVDKFEIHTKFERKVTVSFPEMTKNGTIHAVVFVHKSGVSPWKDSKHVRLVTRLTFQMTPLAPAGSPGSTEEAHKGTEEPRLVSYWKSHITLNMMTEDFTFNNAAVPSDLRRYMKIVEDGKKDKKKLYLPLLLIDEMRSRLKDFNEINITTKAAPLMISYDTITLRKFRIWIHIQAVIFSLKHFGFSEKNLDEIKAMFVESGVHILVLSILVPAFHLSFEVFAFKNDVSFWRGKKSLAGISKRSVIWRCLSTFVIFLYLLEEKSSWLTLIPMGVAVLIELWKVSKVFALQPSFKDERDETERATEEYDAKAMKFLSYLMYPLCISGAMYSFLYLKNKSWYSWTINSLVSGVYAFGFLSMVPQLFINYKLKSVGQLPISVLLYKGLNTFISDVFSGIITTPGPHQLACFRDDVVFLIYLYQRRIYPLNKSRGREYGASHRKKPKSKTHED
ncbi:cleft lip and palate transmembrane protein 1-like protein isoform X2 [Electrophorus electricus]|uniref:cleft lip and palate transmembrane protein 1-like protein isoform X2 n=1 Tax=Electrophorus electricus TaxID=8005 RepID=UPI000F09F855|nr:cleft lip and palate transmembrane protein 1-like protein isoform X2 [Electrophorus electricus]